MAWLLALLLAPVLAGTACLLWRDDATRGRVAAIGGALTLADGKFLTFNGSELIVIEASTEAPKELARSQKLFKK